MGGGSGTGCDGGSFAFDTSVTPASLCSVSIAGAVSDESRAETSVTVAAGGMLLHGTMCINVNARLCSKPSRDGAKVENRGPCLASIH